MNNGVLADKLEVWGFEDNFIIYRDGSLGFVLSLSALDVSCWDDDRVNSLSYLLSSFLNGLPAHTDFQFLQEITGGNLKVLKEFEAINQDGANPLVQMMVRQRVAFFEELDQRNELPLHRLYLLVRRSSTQSFVDKPRLFGKKQNFETISEERLAAELRKLETLLGEIQSNLFALGITSTKIDERDTMALLYKQWNPSRNINLEAYDPNDVRNSILFTDVVISPTSFSLGDYKYKVISLKLLPGNTYSSMGKVLRTLPYDTRAFFNVHVPDQTDEIKALQLQRRVAHSMAYGKNSGVSDIDSQAKFDDLENTLSEMISQGEKIFHFGLNILIRSKTEFGLEDLCSQTLQKLRELDGAEGMVETIAGFEIFNQFAFPNAKVKERTKRIKTSNLADLVPIYGPWPGHAEPKILLRTRYDSILSFDPFSSELTNANQVVSGGSGSGKSYLTNLLLLQLNRLKPLTYIIDIGGSYKRFCENLDGQYIPLSLDAGVSINPFDLLPGESIPSNHKLKFLLALVETISKEDDAPGLRKLERSEVEEAIVDLYKSYPRPKLSNLRDALLRHGNPEIQRIGKILNSWTGTTPFGQFLDRDSTVSLSKRTVCFDLKGLESYPELQAVSLLLITDLVWREVQKDRSTIKAIIFDECWKLLENDAGASFIGEVFRTIRKYYGMCVAISQNIDDFAKSRVATAVMTNSSIKWILKQKGADKERLKTVLELNDNEVTQINTLKQERGKYSEAFLICEDKRILVSVEGTPLEYWIATTDPRDLTKYDEIKSLHNITGFDLLKKLSHDFPHGLAASKTLPEVK